MATYVRPMRLINLSNSDYSSLRVSLARRRTASLGLSIGGKATRDKQVLGYQPVRVASETAAVLDPRKGPSAIPAGWKGRKVPRQTRKYSALVFLQCSGGFQVEYLFQFVQFRRAERVVRFRVGVRDSVPTLRSTEERSRRGFRIRVNRCRAQRKNAHNRNAVFSQIPAHKELHDASTVDSVRRSGAKER